MNHFEIGPPANSGRTYIWPEVWTPGTRYVVRCIGNTYSLEIDESHAALLAALKLAIQYCPEDIIEMGEAAVAAAAEAGQ